MACRWGGVPRCHTCHPPRRGRQWPPLSLRGHRILTPHPSRQVCESKWERLPPPRINEAVRASSPAGTWWYPIKISKQSQPFIVCYSNVTHRNVQALAAHRTKAKLAIHSQPIDPPYLLYMGNSMWNVENHSCTLCRSYLLELQGHGFSRRTGPPGSLPLPPRSGLHTSQCRCS